MIENTQPQTTTLVLGGTGKTGRRVAARLDALGVPTRIGSRQAAPAFDWDDRTTWGPALDGIGAVYVSFQPDLAAPGSAATIEAFVAAARASGVVRLVLLSGRGEPEAERCEQLVLRSGIAATVVRASWFHQNFSESFLLDAVLAGEIALPAGDVAEPFVDADDIADVAVAALTEPGHDGRLYELTGPRLLTFATIADELTAATGRDVRYLPVAPERYAALLGEQRVPDDVVAILSHLFVEVLDGRNASLADGVQRALGREPRDFRDYARDVAAAGAWATQGEVAR